MNQFSLVSTLGTNSSVLSGLIKVFSQVHHFQFYPEKYDHDYTFIRCQCSNIFIQEITYVNRNASNVFSLSLLLHVFSLSLLLHVHWGSFAGLGLLFSLACPPLANRSQEHTCFFKHVQSAVYENFGRGLFQSGHAVLGLPRQFVVFIRSTGTWVSNHTCQQLLYILQCK